MKDNYAAGRAWLLSTAVGEHVEASIDTFIYHAGADPTQITSALYRRAWPKDIAQCDPVVQARIDRFGLREAMVRTPYKAEAMECTFAWKGLVLVLAALAFVLFGFASCAVGAPRILSWLFGG